MEYDSLHFHLHTDLKAHWSFLFLSKFRVICLLLSYLVTLLGILGKSRWLRHCRVIGRLRVRFPIVSFEFFIAINIPASLWSWGRLSLQQKWVPGLFPGVKWAGAYGWQPYHIHVPTVLQSGILNLLEPPGPVQAGNGTALTLLRFLVSCSPSYLC
jgi:hypothetical protein